MLIKIPFLSWTGKADLKVEIADGIEERFRLKAALEIAVGKRADLTDADLTGADLTGTYLTGAYLGGTYLTGAYLGGAYLLGADLGGANLGGANLTGADLTGTYLTGADLTGTYLTGAYLGGKKLIGERPVLIVGPLGSGARYLTAYLTDSGIMVRTGCFFGTLAHFAARVSEVHGDNAHGREYRAVIGLIESHAGIWTPAAAETKAAE